MKSINVFIVLFIVFGTIGCARRGAPSGGPKDEDAPVTIKIIPEFKTVNFNKKEIKIYFDEYIKLKDLTKNLIISPPLKYNADITPLGLPSKRITIKIKDTLKENTTYTFNFGESIVDNAEGNVLEGFKYIFSTGNHIDSLLIKGMVSNALSKQTEKYISILLYEANKEFNDSTIYKEKPLYVTNSLDTLSWELGNLKKGKYHLIALKEKNIDYLFNPKTDKIAFLDSVISLPTDKDFKLKLFKEILDFKALKPVEVSKGHLVFPFEGKPNDFKISLKSKVGSIISKEFYEKDKDTLNFYYKLNTEHDSLVFSLKNNGIEQLETIRLRAKIIDSLIVKSNLRGTIGFNDTLKILTNNPLEKFNKKLFTLYDKDTITVDFSLKADGYRDLLVLFDKKESQNYKLQILPNAITDFFEQRNKDTINYSLKTKKKDNYGSISLKINNPTSKNIIIQLLNTKEELVNQVKNIKDNKVDFELLQPKKYLIRVIIDSNNNGIWDTGNYLKRIQPEDVFYFNKEIEVKENWFVNETIDIK
jgi:uncharacterized protein (DUF2141 family)